MLHKIATSSGFLDKKSRPLNVFRLVYVFMNEFNICDHLKRKFQPGAGRKMRGLTKFFNHFWATFRSYDIFDTIFGIRRKNWFGWGHYLNTEDFVVKWFTPYLQRSSTFFFFWSHFDFWKQKNVFSEILYLKYTRDSIYIICFVKIHGFCENQIYLSIYRNNFSIF